MAERGRSESVFFLGGGPFAAILLGAALVPLRGLTPASNLAFAFIVLTIVVAEFGGRGAAVATALSSALSLDFFLTQPYLRLSIEDKHDVIAFFGLALCGLTAAALSSARSRKLAALSAIAEHRDLMRSVVRGWNLDTRPEPQLEGVLRQAQRVFPVAGAVIRDERERLLASCQPGDAQRPIPDALLEPDGLAPASWQDVQRLGHALPEQGVRIALVTAQRPIGWLDVWGDGRVATAEQRRALSDFARTLALLIAAGGRA